MVYLDNAATTQIDSQVLEAMMPYLTDKYGNAGTIYPLGVESARAIEKARKQVADFIGASPEQIIFTSGGSESNATALASLWDYCKTHGKTHAISSVTEHISVLRNIKKTEDGFHTSLLKPTKGGVVSFGDFTKAVTDVTGFVSIMHTNNETGCMNPVIQIGRYCNEHGLLFHTDCVQAATGSKLDVNEIGCDFLSLSAHKIHAPKGIGALFVRDTSLLKGIILGGENQEFGYRGGTENVPAIVGFGLACELESKRRADDVYCYKNLREAFLRELNKTSIEYSINGSVDETSYKIINLRIHGVDSETLILMLAARGVCISAGSACKAHESEPNYVLKSMGIPDEEIRESIRVSFSRLNTEKEAGGAAWIIADSARALQAMLNICGGLFT